MSKMQDGSAPLGMMDGTGGLDSPAHTLRVGLVARDPLRLLGLQVIVEGTVLGSGLKADVVPLEMAGLLAHANLSIAVIDASCTDHLFELLATFRRTRPQLRVIIIGESNEPDAIQRVIGAGAKGYLTHSAGEAEIRMAIAVVSDGSVWAPRRVLARLLDAPASRTSAARVTAIRFTDREIEVLRSLVSGMGNREIAVKLKIDETTVKAHLTRLMRKAGAKNRIELSLTALEQRFTEPRSLLTVE